MSVQQVQVNVEKEVLDVGNALVALVVKLKAKEPVLQILGEEFAALVGLLNEVSAVPGDVASDVEGSLNAALLVGSALVKALKG